MRDAHMSWREAYNVENNEDDDDACGTDRVVCACRVPMVGDELADPQQPVVVLVLYSWVHHSALVPSLSLALAC